MDDFNPDFNELEEDDVLIPDKLLLSDEDPELEDDDEVENPLVHGFHDPEDVGETPEF